MNGSMAATRRGLNATLASLRTRVCAGGSTLVSVGTGLKSPSARICSVAGHAGFRAESALLAENSLGFSKICRMS